MNRTTSQIFIGCLINSFAQAVTVNDPMGLYKVIMYVLGTVLILYGYYQLMKETQNRKLQKSIYIFVFLVIYGVIVTFVYMNFGGFLSILASIICIAIVSVLDKKLNIL